MAVIISRDKTEPFVTKDGSTIRELMHPARHGCKRQSLAEAVVAPGMATVLHKHHLSEEIYYILAGCGEVRLGNEHHPVTAGDSICILPGIPHNIKNTGDEALLFLCCCSPPYSHEDTELLEPASPS